jgi:DNA-binding transcriptional MerR regulator
MPAATGGWANRCEGITMLLKVGELAKRSGVTVRTLHHYDSIGLLRPSARSAAGYRLYDGADVARLHGIQVLRHIGMALDDIAALLASGGADIQQLLARQMHALQQQIQQAGALHERLMLAQSKYAGGRAPELKDWLDTLQLISACEKHFSRAEVQRIFANWGRIQADWDVVFAETQALMARGAAPSDASVQALAQRWMNLMHLWMHGDFDMMRRWGRMYEAEASVQAQGRPSLAMIRFIDQAIALRMQALQRHLSETEMKSLRPIGEAQWRSLSNTVMELVAQRLPPQAPAARDALRQWSEMLDHTVAHDPVLRTKLKRAYEHEPLLRDAGPLPPAARAYLMQAAQAFALHSQASGAAH